MSRNLLQKRFMDRYLRPVATETRSVPESVRETARRLLRDEARYGECIAMLDAQPGIESDPFGLKLRGVAKLSMKNFDEAEADFLDAIRLLTRESSALHCNLAAVGIERGELDQALTAATTAMSIDCSWYLPVVNTLCALALQGDVDSAWQALVNALESWPDGRFDPELIRYLQSDGILSILRRDGRFQQFLAESNGYINV